jgi:hypothetical protein
VTALTVLPRPEESARLRPVPWRRMIWVTWRQHRGALTGVAGLLGSLALGLWIVGLRLHHAYADASGCHSARSLACSQLISNFNGLYRVLARGSLLQPLAPLIGVFVGAPVLARELESGTFRYTWTQGFGRRRWALAKLVLLALVVTAAAGIMSVLLSWYYQPYFVAGNASRSLAETAPLAPGLFDLRGIAFAAWTLVAFAIGSLAGVLVRRVVPAIAAALAAYTGLALAAALYLRQHYLTALVTTSLDLPGSAWIISQHWLNTGGEPVGQSVLGQVLRQGGSQLAGKGGVPKAMSSWHYLVRHGYTQRTVYQPGRRFWPFQLIEGGWLLALSLLLIAATVWLVGRRAT